MKFNIKTKIQIKEFIPNEIIPRNGPLKELQIRDVDSDIVLTAIRCRSVVLPKYIYLEPADFMAVGLYLAEGSTYCNINNKTKHCGHVDFVNSDPLCVKILCRLLNKFKVETKSLSWKVGLNVNYKNIVNREHLFNYWVDKIGLESNKARPTWIYYSGKIGGRLSNNTSKNGCLHIFYNSTIFRNFFINFIQKIFDESIKNKSKEQVALILKGFFAGDGCVSYSAKYNRRQLEFLSNDLELSNKIKESLKILDLVSIRETWPESTKTHTKSLRIYNKHDFEILSNYDIPNLIDYKRKNFLELMDSLKHIKARI